MSVTPVTVGPHDSHRKTVPLRPPTKRVDRAVCTRDWAGGPDGVPARENLTTSDLSIRAAGDIIEHPDAVLSRSTQQDDDVMTNDS